MGVSLDDFAKKAVESSMRRIHGVDIEVVGCKSVDSVFRSGEHVCKIGLGDVYIYGELYVFEGESIAETLLDVIPNLISSFRFIKEPEIGGYCNTFTESQLFKKYRYEGMLFGHHDAIKRYGEADIDVVVASRIDSAMRILPKGSSFPEVFGYVMADCTQGDFFSQLIEVSGREGSGSACY